MANGPMVNNPGGGGGAWAPGQGNQQAPLQAPRFLPGGNYRQGGPGALARNVQRPGGGIAPGGVIAPPPGQTGGPNGGGRVGPPGSGNSGDGRTWYPPVWTPPYNQQCPPAYEAERDGSGACEPRNGAAPHFVGSDIPPIVFNPIAKRWERNPVKEQEKSFYLKGLGTGNTFANILPANQGTTIAFTCPPGCDFEAVKFMSTQTDRFSIFLQSYNQDIDYMNNPIPNHCFFGFSGFPAYAPETIYLAEDQGLRGRIQDLSGAPNTVKVGTWGRRMVRGGSCSDAFLRERYLASRKRISHPYWVTWDAGISVSLTSGQTVNGNTMTLPGDADFECFGVMDDSTGDYDIQVKEDATGWPITDGFVPARQFFAAPTLAITGMPNNRLSAAGVPFFWPFTMVFRGTSKIQCDLTDTSGAPNDIRLVFYGRLIRRKKIMAGPCPTQ